MSEYRVSTDSARIFQTSSDADELRAAFVAQLEHADTVKYPLALQSFENLAYLMGNHLVAFYFNSAAGTFGVHMYGSDSSEGYDALLAKSADNHLPGAVDSLRSLLTVSEPEPRVTPKSEDPLDLDAAEVSAAVIEETWERPLRMDRLTADLATVGAFCPYGALEIEFGPTDYPQMTPGLKLETRLDLETGEEFEVEVPDPDSPNVSPRHDFVARLWTWFHLTPDPQATSPEDMIWLIRRSYVDKSWAMENFGQAAFGDGYLTVDLDQVHYHGGRRAQESVLYWWHRIQDIIPTPHHYHAGGFTPSRGKFEGSLQQDQLAMSVMDVKPSEEFPRGRTLIFLESTLVYDGPARAWSEKYPWRWHPYSFWGWFRVPGKFDSIPMLTQLLPLQKKINEIDALTHAWRELTSLGQWLVPNHSNIPDGFFSGVPGLIVPYDDIPGMSKPERLLNAPLPQEFFLERNLLVAAIQRISGMGVSGDQQISPSALRSGAQMQQIERMRLQGMTPMLKDFQQCLEQCAQNILIEAQRYLAEGNEELRDRIIEAARGRGIAAVETFIDAGLRDHHAVRIDIVSALMNTPEARKQTAMEFFQASQGQLPPNERAAVLRDLQLDKYARNEEHESVLYANRLLARIQRGMLEFSDNPQADEVQDYLMLGVTKAGAMLPVFNRFVLQDRFHELEPNAQAAVFAMLGLIREAVQAEMQQAMQWAMAQQGAKPAGP